VAALNQLFQEAILLFSEPPNPKVLSSVRYPQIHHFFFKLLDAVGIGSD